MLAVARQVSISNREDSQLNKAIYRPLTTLINLYSSTSIEIFCHTYQCPSLYCPISPSIMILPYNQLIFFPCYRIYMSKKLFTRLDLPNYQNATEIIVNQVIDNLVATSARKYQENQMEKMSKRILTNEVMFKEINSLGQAYITNPIDEPLSEDYGQKLVIKEGNRPFSAKIQKKYLTRNSSSKISMFGPNKRQSTRSTHKYSVCQSAKSRQIKKYGIFRPNYDKFFPIKQEEQLDDSFQSSFIDSLRQKKAKEQAYQQSKQQFLKNNALENEKYSKLNKKFLQTMGSKAYYYTKNGETVETSHANNRLLKKASSNRATPKNQLTKRSSNFVKSEMTVQYHQKQNYFKKTRQGFEIQDKPNILFYKSQQCKYQILT